MTCEYTTVPREPGALPRVGDEILRAFAKAPLRRRAPFYSPGSRDMKTPFLAGAVVRDSRRARATAPRAFANNPFVAIWSSLIGKKVVMALTGVVLVGFVIMHMLGNLKILDGADEINAYAVFLREVGRPELGYGQLLWLVRIILLICVVLHVTAAIQLARMNRDARPVAYKTRRDVETTVAAKTMLWGGWVLVVFIVFHLLHFTVGVVGFQPGQFKHLAVYQNVLAGFSVWPVSLFYIAAMGALCLHLDHGTWSVIQTLGWSTSRNARTLKIISRVIALVVFVGFVTVPLAVLSSWLH
jgi:succinate dehydrogenase / fumarate reductase cytochrome b subunit